MFIDKGEQDGLKVGNRLFIIRKGDAWKNSLATPGAANRIAPVRDPPAPVQKAPPPRHADVPGSQHPSLAGVTVAVRGMARDNNAAAEI